MNIPEFETPKLTNLGVQVLYLLSLRAAPLVNPSDKILAHALPLSYILGLYRDYIGIILGYREMETQKQTWHPAQSQRMFDQRSLGGYYYSIMGYI